MTCNDAVIWIWIEPRHEKTCRGVCEQVRLIKTQTCPLSMLLNPKPLPCIFDLTVLPRTHTHPHIHLQVCFHKTLTEALSQL